MAEGDCSQLPEVVLTVTCALWHPHIIHLLMNTGMSQEDGSVDTVFALQEPKFDPKNPCLKNKVKSEQE